MSPWLSVSFLNTSLGFCHTVLVCYCNKDAMAAFLYQEWVTQPTVREAGKHGSSTRWALRRPHGFWNQSSRAYAGNTSFFARQKSERMSIEQFLPKTHPQWPQDLLLGFTPKVHFIYLKSMLNPVMVFFREKASLNSEFKLFNLYL